MFFKIIQNKYYSKNEEFPHQVEEKIPHLQILVKSRRTYEIFL